MIKRFLLAGILLLSAWSMVRAAPYATNAPVQSNPSATTAPLVSRQRSSVIEQVETQGFVVSVDAVFGQVTIQDELGNTQDFRVHSNVPILLHGVQLKLADLTPGDRVLIRHTSRPPLLQLIQILKDTAR